jgi:serine/threonine protein kinase
LRELLRIPGVDAQARNNKGQTPGDCAHSSRFGFDRSSPEGAVTELLAQASAGTLAPRKSRMGSIEMADWGPSDAGSGPSSAEPRAVDAPGAPGAAAPRSVEVAPEETMASADSKHSVPLRSIGAAEEEAYLERSNSRSSARSMKQQHTLSPHSCGISSFMLSAGLGTMSRSLAVPIPEDNEFHEGPHEVSHTSFDDFTELKALGEGVFGKVALVKHKTTGEVFAMKTMNKAKFKAQKITSTAHSEQFILKTTRHPFVVTLHYAFQGSSFWALVMEYCPHGDLQNQLGIYGSPEMPLDPGARFAGEVLLALEHLHSINVIFRDLKLENVVVDKEYRARVTDFGLAKKLNAAADAKTMCGSYGYAAPEIMMNLGKYTYAVDLYSYGVLLYMLASGGDANPKSPTLRMPPMKHALLKRKLEAAACKQPLRGWWALCGALPDLLDRLLSDEPRRRPSASELKQDPFFAQSLGRSVEVLLQEGPFEPGPRDCVTPKTYNDDSIGGP